MTVWASECRQSSWIRDRVQRANFRLWRQSDPDRHSLCSSMAEWSVPSRCSGAIEPGTALRQQADAAPVIHDLALSGLEQPLHLRRGPGRAARGRRRPACSEFVGGVSGRDAGGAVFLNGSCPCRRRYAAPWRWRAHPN